MIRAQIQILQLRQIAEVVRYRMEHVATQVEALQRGQAGNETKDFSLFTLGMMADKTTKDIVLRGKIELHAPLVVKSVVKRNPHLLCQQVDGIEIIHVSLADCR